MDHDREFDRAHHFATPTNHDAAPTPNRATRSSLLEAPTQPIVSGLLQRKADGDGPRDGNGVSATAHEALAGTAGSSGRALDGALRTRFESSLGADLSSVRIHTGPTSASAAAAVGARAYTVGQDIHFGAGHYDPSSAAGVHLIAHEVAHTVQQKGGTPVRQHKLEISAPGDHAELEADRAADAMVAGSQALVGSAGAALHRDPLKDPKADPFGVTPAPAATPASPLLAPPGAAPAPAVAPGPAAGPAVAPVSPAGGAKGDKAPPAPVVHGKGPETEPPVAARGPAPATAKRDVPGGNTPDSGTEWDKFWNGTGGNAVRSGLEITRFVPGWGLIGGIGADVIEFKQNQDSLNDVAATPAGSRMADALAVRQGLVVINNVLGHLRYLGTLAQDGVITSVVGVPLTGLTGPVNEALNAVNLVTNSLQMGMDLGIAVSASMLAKKQGEGTKAYEAYHALQTNFIISTATDAVGIFLDIADAATGSLANASVIKQAKGFIKGTTIAVKTMRVPLTALVKNLIGVWGPQAWKAVEDGLGGSKTPAQRNAAPAAQGVAPAAGTHAIGAQVGPHGMLRSVAGKIMMAELNEIEGSYRLGNMVVEQALGMPAQMAKNVNTVIKQMTGAKDPFVWMRDKLASGIHEGTARVAGMLQMKGTAAQAEKVARSSTAAIDGAVAAVDKIQMPTIAPSKSNFGDGAVAHTAASVVDGAKNLGAGAINSVTARLQAAIDAVKAPAKQQAVELKADLAWTLEFLAEFQTTINEQTAKIGQQGAQFAAKLGQCKNVDDIFNLLFGLGAQIMGADEFSVDDLRHLWTDVRANIDQGFKTAREVVGGATGGGAATQPGASATQPGASASQPGSPARA